MREKYANFKIGIIIFLLKQWRRFYFVFALVQLEDFQQCKVDNHATWAQITIVSYNVSHKDVFPTYFAGNELLFKYTTQIFAKNFSVFWAFYHGDKHFFR